MAQKDVSHFPCLSATRDKKCYLNILFLVVPYKRNEIIFKKEFIKRSVFIEMLGLFLGILLLIIGLFIIPIGFAELKDELGVYSDKPLFKKLFIYTIEIFSSFSFSNYLGWLLGIGFLLVISGFYFVILFFF